MTTYKVELVDRATGEVLEERDCPPEDYRLFRALYPVAAQTDSGFLIRVLERAE